MRLSRLPLLLFSLATCLAHAHQDPRGDVHPWVTVVNGMFQVIFYANGPDFRAPHRYRVIYSPEGKVVVPRHQLTDEESDRIFGDMRLRRTGLRTDFPRIEQFFPDTGGPADPFHREGRQLLVLVDQKNSVMESIPLPLDATSLAFLADSWIGPTHAAILWQKAEGIDQDQQTQRLRLTLSWMRRGDFSEPVTKDLGESAQIYDFPTASNLVWARGRLWVAWMRINNGPKAGPRGLDTVLTSYDPIADKVETKPLNGPAHWNSHLSMATTGGWLCAAWHCSVDGSYPGTAQIITVFEKLPEQTPVKP